MSLRYPGGLITKSPTAPTTSAAKGVWTLEQALQYIKAGTWPLSALGDPYFQYNSILLPGQGTNGAQNNTFLDSSTNNFTITRNGNTTQGTFTPFSQADGYWANYFYGQSGVANGSLNATHPSMNATWTIEAWIYRTTGSADQCIVFMNNGGVSGILFYIDSSNYLRINDGVTVLAAFSNVSVPVNAWTHVAVVRNGGTTTGYVNGVVAGSNTFTPATVSSIRIGEYASPSFWFFPGYMSNVRVVNGSAVYTSAFTPPTSPLTAITNTSILTCQSNRFKDNSANNYAVTPNGNVSVTPFEPFGAPTSAYSASTVGGSGYFDGSGDYLSTSGGSATAMGTGDFTWELFVYITATAQYQDFIDTRSNPVSGSSDGFALTLNTGTLTPIVYTTSSILSSSINVTLNAWNHIALTRSGTTLTIWVNGVSGGTLTNSTNLSNQSLSIGGANTTNVFTNGYISGLRMTKGAALYTTTFTPPTSPPTTTVSSGTVSLLCNFTNAGIIDNAEKNDLETVGNAQISTSQYKWGTSSMYFDGTGDYLNIRNNPNLYLGSGDSTIECWIYKSSSSTMGIMSQQNASSGWTLRVNSDNTVQFFFVSSSSVTSSATVPNSTWTHIAVVRVGTNVKIYINGLASGSATFGTETDAGSLVAVGVERDGSGAFSGYIADLRVTKGYARYPYNFTAPTAALPLFYQAAATPSADPYFENTTLLLPGNGTNGANNNTFLDSSTNAFTITRNGNTTQGTFSPFSQTGWSNFISSDGSAAFSVAYNAGFAPGSGDFTVEAWVYFTGVGGADQNIIGNISASTGDGDWFLGWRGGANRFEFSASSSGLLAGLQRSYNTTVPVVGQWYHVVGVKSGSTLSCYVNGSKGTDATLSTVSNGSLTLYIGQGTPGNGRLYGYISNARIVKGTAVYSGSSFTVPTAPLTAITNTQLLTCQSNRFVDNSTNNFTITVAAGTPSVQAFSPFNPTASYSTSTVGGSGYFDEAGDYLATPTNAAFQLGTGDFSIEAWIYPTKTPAGQYPTIFRFESGGYNGNGITFFWRRYNVASTGVSVDCGGVIGLSGTSTVPVGAWTHVAFTRTGNDFALFVNGVREATTNNSNNFSTNVPVNIGYSSGGSEFPGYISSARVVKGSNPYGVGTTLTIPTAPLTAITNTSLLLNFTNGGITDATAKNDLETVGGASISTTQSKFGGSSIYLDGNGDYLKRPSSQFYVFNGDFTIEFWTWKSASGLNNYDTPVSCDSDGNATNGWALELGTVRYFYFTANAGGFTLGSSSFTVNDSAWHHYAITRYGSSVKMFRDGVQIASGTYSSAIGNSSIPELKVGAYGNASTNSYNGYINDLRITNGIARYTTNFTPPTSAFLTL